MSAYQSVEIDLTMYRLVLSARPVQCKTGLAIGRGGNQKLVHCTRSASAACAEGRLRYFATWLCGDCCLDATLVADPASHGDMCQRCESLAAGPFVYRCFDADGQLLYIGSARCRVSRFQGHRNTSAWWPQVTRTDLADQPDIETARRVEAAAIYAEQPLHNKRHKVRRSSVVMAGAA